MCCLFAVLDTVQHWPVFVEISEIFILVPALLGLKGNLEMTLASRLSTAANLGKMDGRPAAAALILGNLALVQCQAGLEKPSPVGFFGYFGFFLVFWFFYIFAQKKEFLGFFQLQEHF
jgi:cation transporter-like permease